MVTEDGIMKAAQQAVAIAKANSKFQTEPVKLAPVKAHGEVVWKTPIEINPFTVPVAEKADLLLRANAAALEYGANFISSNLISGK